MTSRDGIVSRYLDYLDACNRRAWEEVRTYPADSVLVNGSPQTKDEYVSDLATTVEVFPNYRWRMLRAVVEGE
jgi:predicted ester cyclase